MATGETKEQGRTPDSIRDEVRQTFRRLSDLAQSEPDFERFSNTVLEQAVSITGAHGAVLWQRSGNQAPAITHKAGQSPSPFASSVVSTDHQVHNSALLHVMQAKQPLDLEWEKFSSQAAADEIPFMVLLAPVLNRANECHGVVELLQRGDVSTQAKEGYLRFLCQVTQLFQRWHEQQDLAKLTRHADTWSERLDFIGEAHSSIDHKETAYSIANEARRLLNCDRVSVARWNGSRCKIEAISSQDKFDNRANVVKKLARIATASVSADAPFWILGDTEGIAPEVAKRINDYLDESHSRTLAVLPLTAKLPNTPDLEMKSRRKKKARKLGALIIEYFDQDVAQERIEDDCKLIVKQSELALDNARKHGEIFLLPIWKRLGWLQQLLFRDHFAKTITGLVALALLLAAMLFWPVELRMKVDGAMQPTNRRTIFAQTEGIVKKVSVGNRAEVQEGDLLLELANPELDLQIVDVTGRMLTLDQQIRAVEFQMARGVKDKSERMEMSSSLNLYRKRKENLVDQQKLLEQKKRLQNIYSPITGTLVTWDAERRLPGLPVSANQAVLAVDDLTGEWQLELKIPQNKIGYVTEAMLQADGNPLEVEFTVETNPNLRLKAELVEVANRAEASDQGIPEFRAVAKASMEDAKDLRPGAGVTAKIDCGQKKLWFICFYQVYDWVRTKVLF